MAERLKRMVAGIKRRTSSAWRSMRNKPLEEQKSESPEEIGFIKLRGAKVDSDGSEIVEVQWDIIRRAQEAQALGQRTDSVCEWSYSKIQAAEGSEVYRLHPESGPV